MPSFLTKAFNTYFKNIFAIDQASNIGVDSTTRKIQDGLGQNTSTSISDDVLSVQPVNDNTTGTFLVKDKGGSNILAVDTSTTAGGSKVLAGASQVNTLTLFKEMGLYDFSPSVGFHYPLIAQNLLFTTNSTYFAGDSDWGYATDPATTLDVSLLTQQENAIAVYWYLENNITLDSVRFMATADGSVTLNFHLFAYTLDEGSNHGDLSGGLVHANATVAATNSTIKTGTFSLDEADIDAGKIVIGFVENVTNTNDISCSFNIKYHIR
jgi:hypothetical protein